MNFEAHMRVASLEIAGALLAVAVVASRPRRFGTGEHDEGNRIGIALRFVDTSAERRFEGVCPVTIGRSSDVEVAVPDPEVSRRHARLEPHGRIVYLRDLQSSNGTFLNGHRVGRAIEIRAGDEIDVGTTRLLVEQLSPWT
ncbi:MAG: FHA domain-containing protein [Candidatus Eremiobacteraeota bacterium]|nr:FHA domain-containing protein [Candidatus Eremiobacteraeota bacterium]